MPSKDGCTTRCRTAPPRVQGTRRLGHNTVRAQGTPSSARQEGPAGNGHNPAVRLGDPSSARDKAQRGPARRPCPPARGALRREPLPPACSPPQNHSAPFCLLPRLSPTTPSCGAGRGRRAASGGSENRRGGARATASAAPAAARARPAAAQRRGPHQVPDRGSGEGRECPAAAPHLLAPPWRCPTARSSPAAAVATPPPPGPLTTAAPIGRDARRADPGGGSSRPRPQSQPRGGRGERASRSLRLPDGQRLPLPSPPTCPLCLSALPPARPTPPGRPGPAALRQPPFALSACEPNRRVQACSAAWGHHRCPFVWGQLWAVTRKPQKKWFSNSCPENNCRQWIPPPFFLLSLS